MIGQELVARRCITCGSNNVKKIKAGQYVCEYCGSCYETEESFATADGKPAPRNVTEAISLAKQYDEKDDFYAELNILKEFEDEGADNIIFMMYLGIAYRRCKMPEKALECYEKCKVLNPGDANIYGNIGTVYFSLKDYKNALPYYEQCISIMKKDPMSYSQSDKATNLANYGAVLYANGKKIKGNRCIKRAESMGYKNGDALKMMVGIKKII